MTLHLIESTIVLAIAMAFAQMPRLTARTRFAILYIGLLKFAVPSSLVTRALDAYNVHPVIVRHMPAFLGGPAAAAPKSGVDVVFWLWLTGFVAIALQQAWRTVAVYGRLRHAEPAMIPGVVRSGAFASPATIGIFRPTIVLPASCSFDDNELAAILAHERAHIARRDNLLGIVEALFGAALWFHPLVWIARALLAKTREEACDAAVIERGDRDAYVRAIAKLFRAAITPPPPAVSCIVNNSWKERMEHMARYDALRRRALPHRIVVFAIAVMIGAATIGTGVLRAQSSDADPYTVTMQQTGDLYEITVTERATGTVVQHPQVRTHTDATITDTKNGRTFVVHLEPSVSQVTLDVTEDGKTIQHTTLVQTKYTGEPITLNLKGADIRDLFKMFGQLTNIQFIVDDDVNGTVTIRVKDVPWDQALDMILSEHALKATSEGKGTLHISKK